MKVIIADNISERGVELLKKTGWNIVQTTKESLPGELADAEALIVRSATRVTSELMDQGPRLRVVGRAGVGVDNIDLDEATKRGILVMSTPGGSSVSVAEHTIALLLALVRQIPRFDAAMRAGKWEKSSSGAEVRDKTLGLVGLGRIGREVAIRAAGFDMRLLAFDPYLSEAAAGELSVELVPLEKLFAESDFISLHTPVGPQTQGMINAAALAQMKKGVRIINAARGELINEADLAAALKSGSMLASPLGLPIGLQLYSVREMMAKDPKLKAEFERKIASDPVFAGSSAARLEFFYERSPWFAANRTGVYPVGRLMSVDGISGVQGR